MTKNEISRRQKKVSEMELTEMIEKNEEMKMEIVVLPNHEKNLNENEKSEKLKLHLFHEKEEKKIRNLRGLKGQEKL
jgi:hypothetical protein